MITDYTEPFQPRDPKYFRNEKNSRPFLPSWFDHNEWNTWLHYDQEKEAAFCFTCIKAIEKNLMSTNNAEKSFTYVGYTNWNDAATNHRGFHKHNGSAAHKEAHKALHVTPTQCEDVGCQISEAHAEESSESSSIVENITKCSFFTPDKHFLFVGKVTEPIATSLNYIFSEKMTILS